jgi:hypothetical protein
MVSFRGISIRNYEPFIKEYLSKIMNGSLYYITQQQQRQQPELLLLRVMLD